MSRSRESGAYLGGIGAMLQEADVCILCGEVHPTRHFGLRHGERGECPKVIMGRFPLISDSDGVSEETPLRGSASQRIREYEAPPVPPPPRSEPRRQMSADLDARARALGVPWLPPPDLGAVI